MKTLIFVLFIVVAIGSETALADSWQPSPGHAQVPIWPGTVPDAIPNPKPESVGPPAGREWWPRANDVSRPTMTMYAPRAATPAWLWWCSPAGVTSSWPWIPRVRRSATG